MPSAFRRCVRCLLLDTVLGGSPGFGGCPGGAGHPVPSSQEGSPSGPPPNAATDAVPPVPQGCIPESSRAARPRDPAISSSAVRCHPVRSASRAVPGSSPPPQAAGIFCRSLPAVRRVLTCPAGSSTTGWIPHRWVSRQRAWATMKTRSLFCGAPNAAAGKTNGLAS